MEPVLIRKDDDLIKQKKQNLEHMLIAGQEIYDLFKPLGIELTPIDLHDLLHRKWETNPSVNFLHDFVADKIIDKAGSPDFNGVPINKTKLRDLVEVPDVSEITKRIVQIANSWDHRPNMKLKGFIAGQVQIKDWKVIPKDDLHREIEDMHTHYTQTNRGNEAAAKLNEFVEKYKEVSEFLGNKKNGQPFWPMRNLDLPGLIPMDKPLPKDKHQVVTGGDNGGGLLITTEYTGHRLDLAVIRSQEELFPDKSAK